MAAPMPLDAPVTTATPRFMARRYRVPRRGSAGVTGSSFDRRRRPPERLGQGDGEEGAGDPPLVAGEPVEHHLERILERLAQEPEEGEAREDAGGQHDGVGAGGHVPGAGQEAHEVAADHQEHDRQATPCRTSARPSGWWPGCRRPGVPASAGPGRRTRSRAGRRATAGMSRRSEADDDVGHGADAGGHRQQEVAVAGRQRQQRSRVVLGQVGRQDRADVGRHQQGGDDAEQEGEAQPARAAPPAPGAGARQRRAPCPHARGQEPAAVQRYGSGGRRPPSVVAVACTPGPSASESAVDVVRSGPDGAVKVPVKVPSRRRSDGRVG